MLTVNSSTYVKLPTFYMIRDFNFVISFYFLVSYMEVPETVPLYVALNTVFLKLKYLQSGLKLLNGVCKCGVQVPVTYFVRFGWLFFVYFMPEL